MKRCRGRDRALDHVIARLRHGWPLDNPDRPVRERLQHRGSRLGIQIADVDRRAAGEVDGVFNRCGGVVGASRAPDQDQCAVETVLGNACKRRMDVYHWEHNTRMMPPSARRIASAMVVAIVATFATAVFAQRGQSRDPDWQPRIWVGGGRFYRDPPRWATPRSEEHT